MTARVSRALQIGLGLAGLAGALVMVRHTDFDAVRAFGRWVVLVVAVEGLRVFAEAMATRCLLGREVRLPWWPLLRVHLTGYAIAMIMPAGRSVAEASKAVMLRRWLTTERCAGVGATNQALVMLAAGVVALPCALAALAAAHVVLAGAIAVQALSLLVAGGGLLAMLRSQRFTTWVARRLPRAAAVVRGAGEGAQVPGVPGALGWFALHRGVQAFQIGVLLATLHRFEPLRTFALTGASIVGTSVGVAVPGQLGVVGGALALAAPGLGLTAAQGLALALVLHAAQLAWVVVGFAVWTVTRPGARPSARERKTGAQ